MRKLKAVLGATAIAALGIVPAAQAANAPEGCVKERGTIICGPVADEPHNNWTTDSTKKGSVNSSHEEETTATNPGGNVPPGQQS